MYSDKCQNTTHGVTWGITSSFWEVREAISEVNGKTPKVRPTEMTFLPPIPFFFASSPKFNKHKPWIETSYHGVITENNDTVILDPPLVALDKDAPVPFAVNKHKPWIETSYHGVITENNDTVILDPPLVALDKDAPVPFADDVSRDPTGGLNITMMSHDEKRRQKL
ncbi:Calsyntenin-2 [Tupaia chinensis]|uniref:Calsyntenin-2 n=1 Tax=Tupaia chinensis TaxID=246437 RepID=L9JDZ1_TUPCH|nr:Calsyntenin-2 [Tupaia chinensis]